MNHHDSMNGLPPKFKDKPFTASQFKKSGRSRYELKLLLDAGIVEQIARGTYRSSSADYTEEERFQIATLRAGPKSAICLISALSIYDLTDNRHSKVWIMVPRNKISRAKDLKILRPRHPMWNVGIEKQDGYSITTIDRTIVDCFIYRSQLGSTYGTKALRQAIERKQTTLKRVMEMAIELGAQDRLRPYVEALG